MARPRKEGLDYFPHDTDAAGDEKVEPLHITYGPDGYAFYFVLLERIYRTPNAEIDVSPPHMLSTLAGKVRISLDRFMQILDTALTIGAFDRDEYEKRHILTSHGIKKRAGKVWGKRDRDRESYEEEKEEKLTGGGDEDEDSTVVSGVETNNGNDTTEIDKGNEVNPLLSLSSSLVSEKEEGDKVQDTERKEKPHDKGREKKPEPEKIQYAEDVLLTVDEYLKLLNKYGESDTAWMINKLSNHKGANGQKYKSDYKAIQKWVVDALAEAKKKGIITGQARAPDVPRAYQTLHDWAKEDDPP